MNPCPARPVYMASSFKPSKMSLKLILTLKALTIFAETMEIKGFFSI